MQSFPSLPLEEQELVKNQCMSCSPITSSVSVTGGSPAGNRCQEPRAHVAFGDFRKLGAAVEHVHLPKPRKPGLRQEVVTAIFPERSLFLCLFLGVFVQEAYGIFSHGGHSDWANLPVMLCKLRETKLCSN